MKKIYFTFMLAFMAMMSVTAQVGNYTGTMTINFNGANPVPNQPIQILNDEANEGKFKIRIEHFSFAVVNDATLEVDNVTATPTTSGYTLSREGVATITLTIMGQEGTAEITVNGTGNTVEGNNLKLDLGILALPGTGNIAVGVTYDGNITTGIYETTQDNAKVITYYSITGKKLPAEPESGLFIVKYSSGKSMKVVK